MTRNAHPAGRLNLPLTLSGLLLIAPPAAALDLGAHMVAFTLWAVTALPAYLSAVRLIGRWTSPGQTVPAREWLGLLLAWALISSLLGSAGLTPLGWLLLPAQWALGVRLAEKQGWPRRPAIITAIGGFAGFALYAFLGGLLLRSSGTWVTWGWWVLLPLVWLLWLRLPTVPSKSPEAPPA
jgi:hypothetical protein